MLKHLLTSRATILNEVQATENRYGDGVKTYQNTSGTTWACRVDPVSSEEFEVDRDTRKSEFHLFLTEKAVGEIDALSHVVVDSITYEVVGEPRTFRRRSRPSHIECTLRVLEA